MKRFLTIILLSTAFFGLSAGNPAKLFDEFKNAENAEYVKVPKVLMLAARAGGSFNGVPMTGKISGIKVLSLESAGNRTRTDFDRRLKEEMNGFDELLNVKDNSRRVRIFSRTEGNKFKNLYILTTDSADCAFIELSGKFSAEDLKKIAENE